MSALKAGDSFPEGVAFAWIPPTKETSEFSQCGIPIKYDATAEFKNKKVVIISLPGAFTPTCSARHVPGFKENKDKLVAKGVEQVIVLAHNDAYVMSGWGKANGVSDEFIVFASDSDLKFSKSLGWTVNNGERSDRWAIVVDHGKVTYAAKEEELQSLDFSGFDVVYKHL
ncbi:unnamed protein product [Clonostachys solani]|uniref:Redoxin domain-containing protein n=1 Tax=Clonostachys solani TaxID=160281 RepID=A0A9N9YVN3_9HYPO|nr:unnamed protein product [Clonostachys solani]